MRVKQAENVVKLLEYFAERKAPATLSELARTFNWPRSSAFNIISTLVDTGFLYEPRARGGYYPTPRWLQLAQEIALAEPIPEPLSRILRRLADISGETVWIAAPSGQHAVFIDIIESQASVRYAAHVGKRVPIYATASGLALLSQMSGKDFDATLRKVVFERYSPTTPMNKKEVQKEISRSLERGWFKSESSYSTDLGGVSMPIVDENRIFAATVAGPLYRMRVRMNEVADLMKEAIEAEYGRGYLHGLLDASDISSNIGA
jgi:IclR family transcriptional regulator, acetate operon repressor